MVRSECKSLATFIKIFLVYIAIFFPAPLSKGTDALPLSGNVEVLGEQDQHQQRRVKRSVTQTLCERPTDLHAMFEQLNTQVGASHFLRPAQNGEAIAFSAGSQFLSADDHESKTCPDTYDRTENASVSHRSLCPYYFDILHLPVGYYPPTLQWAKCKCQQCIENSVLSCVPIYTPITVLKPNGCSQGMQLYVEEVLPGGVSTACTCAFNGKAVGVGVRPEISAASIPQFGEE